MNQLSVIKSGFEKINTTKVLIGIVGAGAAYLLLKNSGLFGKTKKEEAIEKAERGQVSKEIDELNKKKINPTYSDTQYTVAANTIYNSLRYSYIGDDYSLAMDTFTKHVYNDADFLKLLSAYGKRRLTPFGVPVGDEIGLIETLNDQLSKSRVNTINSTLLQRGITYKV